MLSASAPCASLLHRAVAPRRENEVPLDHVEAHLEAAGRELLLEQLVHRQRQHLARAGGRDHRLDLDRLAGVTRVGDQLLRLLRVVGVVLGGVAEERVRLLEVAHGGLGQAAEHLHHRRAVDAVVDRLPHAPVAERRVLARHVEHPRPVVRVGVGDEDVARALEARHRVGRRHLDPVDLAGAERRDPRVRLGDRQQHELVELRDARLVPVVGVLHQLGALARRPGGELERPGARRRLRLGLPRAGLSPSSSGSPSAARP